ncbi:MAG TPA: hypothetical protein DCY42_03740 [Chloroflexi bacterium]|nr:hypothetical protein [Chloroflexota bacterium]
MTKRIDQYLDELKTQMADCDKATIQDALADAHEHFSTALSILQAEDPSLNEDQALQKIIAEYGSPEEIAAEYQQVEFYLKPYSSRRSGSEARGPFARFFGIFIDPAAWGSFLFMVIALITGVLYFSWVTTGAALALSFSLFLFGVPLAVLFLLSLQGLGWLEGRMVEGLLGVRMPRRPIFFPTEEKWLDRLKLYLTDKRTWMTMVYLVLQLPFGILYIIIWSAIVAYSLVLIATPFVQDVFGLPIIHYGTGYYFLPTSYYPFAMLMGVVSLTAFMHLAKWIGKIHGKYAKFMLVAD